MLRGTSVPILSVPRGGTGRPICINILLTSVSRRATVDLATAEGTPTYSKGPAATPLATPRLEPYTPITTVYSFTTLPIKSMAPVVFSRMA